MVLHAAAAFLVGEEEILVAPCLFEKVSNVRTVGRVGCPHSITVWMF